jgi:hypothetical protein
LPLFLKGFSSSSLEPIKWVSITHGGTNSDHFISTDPSPIPTQHFLLPQIRTSSLSFSYGAFSPFPSIAAIHSSPISITFFHFDSKIINTKRFPDNTKRRRSELVVMDGFTI